MYDYCDLSTVEDKYTLVNEDGTLTTFVEFSGTFTMLAYHGFNIALEEIEGRLAGILKKPGFKLHFVFSRDPEQAKRLIRRSVKPSKATMKRLLLNLGAMLDERETTLSNKTSIERCFMVLTSNSQSLTKAAVQHALADRTNHVKPFGIGIKPGEFSQSPFLAIRAIKQTHAGFVDSVINAFKERCTLRVMEVHEAVRSLKIQISDDYTSDDWMPNLLGDRLPKRVSKDSPLKADVSHILNPPIGYQLFNQNPSISTEDVSLVRMGESYIAPLLVDIPPQDPKPFTELFNAIPDNVPWRWSFCITTGHDDVISKIGTKHGFASLLAFSSSENKMIKAAAEELINLANDDGEVLVSGNMSLCTWGKDIREVNKRKALITQSVQGWGSTDVIEERGDPIQAWVSSLPGFTGKQISNTFAITLKEAFYMLPLNRPASPWEAGSMLFRTIDNKAYPFQPGSGQQTSWNDLVFAPPGYGKSFFLAASNMGLILSPGKKQLPRIAIIDIGPSSKHFVDMIKESLPEHQRYLAASFKIEMNDKFSVNIFDTPLGSRRPLAIDREFLINFISLLLTPAGAKEQPKRITEFTSSLIDSMYDYFSDDRNPNNYEPGISPVVDKALLDINAPILPGQTTWWELVDQLFDKKRYPDAILAQRYAVPTLNDATQVLSGDDQLKDLYKEARTDGENLLGFVKSMLVSVVKDYPIVSNASVFDVGEARIVSMDLSSVAKSGSAAADKKTGVTYMLARQILCREYYRNLETLDEIESRYKEYHRRRIEKESESPKKICMDEFHRTHACQPVRDQALIDMREGRKFDVHICLLSQLVEDFDDKMVKISNNIYILSKGISEETVTAIKEKFEPSKDAIVGLKRYVTGPGPEGSTMLYIGSLKGGANSRIEQVLRLTLGPVEIWAYTTTHEDVHLRRKLVEKVGLNTALGILAQEFPRGAKEYINAQGLGEGEGEEVYDENDNVFDKIARELVIKYHSYIENAA